MAGSEGGFATCHILFYHTRKFNYVWNYLRIKYYLRRRTFKYIVLIFCISDRNFVFVLTYFFKVDDNHDQLIATHEN